MRCALLVLVVACGSPERGPRAPAGPPGPQPATAAALDACGTCESGTRCFLTGGTGKCFASPRKVCDEPSCACFESDPCAANLLGACSGYDYGVPQCTR